MSTFPMKENHFSHKFHESEVRIKLTILEEKAFALTIQKSVLIEKNNCVVRLYTLGEVVQNQLRISCLSNFHFIVKCLNIDSLRISIDITAKN